MTKCKNCGALLKGKYCQDCGQKVYNDHDRSVGHLFEELFHFITHFEGTFFTTLKAVVLKPGQLTLDYCQGIRKKYYKPVSFFLILVILYLIFPVFSSLNQPLENLPEKEMFGLCQYHHEIEAKQITGHISYEQLADQYHYKSEKLSKILLFLLIPFSAFILYLIQWRKLKYLFDYFILATEMNIVFLILYTTVLPLVLISLAYSSNLLFGKVMFDNDNSAIAAFIVLFGFYTYRAFHRVFTSSMIMTVLFAALFVFAHLVIVQPFYRVVLFKMTLFLIH